MYSHAYSMRILTLFLKLFRNSRKYIMINYSSYDIQFNLFIKKLIYIL